MNKDFNISMFLSHHCVLQSKLNPFPVKLYLCAGDYHIEMYKCSTVPVLVTKVSLIRHCYLIDQSITSQL